MISRRWFLWSAAGALAARSGVFGKEGVPPLLDHVLLGCSDLQLGVETVEKHLGVRAAYGGVHPGRGTRNALLALGERRYLEIIAPDSEQRGARGAETFARLSAPRLAGWAAHVSDLESLAARLRAAGIAFHDPQPGSRKRPDGRVLGWKSLGLKDDRGGLLPFFIQWNTDSVHPSEDAPKGCSLFRFEAVAPDPDELKRLSALLGLDLDVIKGDKPQLRAILTGPGGRYSVTS